MPGPNELPVVNVNFPCRDERDFQKRFAPHMGREGLFVPADPPLQLGARVALRIHWIGGEVGVRGQAVVAEVSRPGKIPGMTLKVVALDAGSARFPLGDEPPAPVYDRFGSGETEPPATLEDFDAPESGPGLRTTVATLEAEGKTRVAAPPAELIHAAGGIEKELFPAPRLRFGDYWLLAPVAGTAELDVWVASRREGVEPEGPLRVVKAARAGHGVETAFGRALLEQLAAVASLSHPDLAQVVDSGLVLGRPFLAFEHLHGRTLGACLVRLRALSVAPPVELALTVGLHVCRALEFLHGGAGPAPVVHGAVEPAHVFLGERGEVRLEGLGFAAAARVAAGAAGAPTPADDCHALGVMLHDLLTLGEPPPGVDPSAAARWSRAPSDWNRAIPAEVDRLVLDATARRYDSAGFRAALEAQSSQLASWSLASVMQEMFGPELELDHAQLDALTGAAPLL